MKKKPYIGITGFMSSKEIEDVIHDIDLQAAGRLLMVGVLVSSKTMQGIKNKWPNRYPDFNEVKNIFIRNENCLNLIHFNTKNPDDLFSELVDITRKVCSCLDGFQLNISWPSVSHLKGFKEIFPDMQIVLQIGQNAFDQVNNDPIILAESIEEYLGSIDYVLLDPSGGLGQPFDPEVAKGYLDALKQFEDRLGLGVAGGLSPFTLHHLLDDLIQEYPDLSIDAEGGLRTPEDHLHTPIAREYARESLEMFSVAK